MEAVEVVWAMKEAETVWRVEVEWAVEVGESVMVSCTVFTVRATYFADSSPVCVLVYQYAFITKAIVSSQTQIEPLFYTNPDKHD